MSTHSMLREIHDGTDMWTIIVKVFRKWNVYQKTTPSELFCVSLLLVDAEGTKIQASVLLKSMHAQFCQSILEGKTYEFANFVVSPNNFKYRPTNHPFKLTFTNYTCISEEATSLPPCAYSFKSISDILNLDDEEDFDYLFDVIAFVKSIASLDEQRKDHVTKYWLRMILTDVDDNEIECVLFDQCASDAFMAQLENHDTPVVVLLSLARTGWTEDKKRQISSSFTATRVAFNPPIKEVKDLIQSAKDRSSPLLTTLTQSMPTPMSCASGSSSLHTQPKVTLSNINDQGTGSTFVVSDEVLKFESKYGWIYDGCSKCSSKPKPKDDNNPNSPLLCPGCRNTPASLEPKMKLHYIVKDETGSTSVIFWDKLAVQLLDKNAVQMKLLVPEKHKTNGFPKAVEDPIGKKLLLKLKLNDYNKKFPGSSISVCEFTVCEDLMQQFDAVSTEDGGLPVNVSEQDTVSEDYYDSTDALSDQPVHDGTTRGKDPIVVEDTTCIDLTQPGTQALPKGKRRTYLTRSGVKDESLYLSQESKVSNQDERILKLIKQEKLS